MPIEPENILLPSHIPGERMVNALSNNKRKKFADMPCTRELMITAAGYHPHAKGHHCKRPKGINEFVFLYCIDGAGYVKYRDTDLIVTRNQGVFLKPNVAHEYGASTSKPWSYYYIHYQGTLATEYTRLILDEQESGTYWIKETEEYLRCFTMILSNLAEGWTYPRMMTSSAYLHELLSYIYMKKQDAAERAPYLPADTRVQAVAEMIEENPQNPVSILELARAANLSTSRFRELFKQQQGVSPKKYALRMQMEKAKELLVSSDFCIYEVAEKVGIPEAHYFTRLFSKKVGMSPSEYRQTHQNQGEEGQK